jgi:hypothetical protein
MIVQDAQRISNVGYRIRISVRPRTTSATATKGARFAVISKAGRFR